MASSARFYLCSFRRNRRLPTFFVFLSAFHQDPSARSPENLDTDCIAIVSSNFCRPKFYFLPSFLPRFISPTDKKVLTEELHRPPTSSSSSPVLISAHLNIAFLTTDEHRIASHRAFIPMTPSRSREERGVKRKEGRKTLLPRQDRALLSSDLCHSWVPINMHTGSVLLLLLHHARPVRGNTI